MRALVIHGPNLNLLGRRDPAVYGSESLDDINSLLLEQAAELSLELVLRQSAREGEIIEWLHAGIDDVSGALLNPGAYAHTSRAIADAVEAVPYPVIEVHLSNIHAREPWRRESVTAPACAGIVAGFGAMSYTVALRALARLMRG